MSSSRHAPTFGPYSAQERACRSSTPAFSGLPIGPMPGAELSVQPSSMTLTEMASGLGKATLIRRRRSASALKLGITSRAKARRLATEALGSTSRMLVAPPASSSLSRAITSSGVPSSGAVSSSTRSASLSRARSPITLDDALAGGVGGRALALVVDHLQWPRGRDHQRIVGRPTRSHSSRNIAMRSMIWWVCASWSSSRL